MRHSRKQQQEKFNLCTVDRSRIAAAALCCMFKRRRHVIIVSCICRYAVLFCPSPEGSGLWGRTDSIRIFHFVSPPIGSCLIWMWNKLHILVYRQAGGDFFYSLHSDFSASPSAPPAMQIMANLNLPGDTSQDLILINIFTFKTAQWEYIISANSALPLTEGPGSHGNPHKMTQGMQGR